MPYATKCPICHTDLLPIGLGWVVFFSGGGKLNEPSHLYIRGSSILTREAVIIVGSYLDLLLGKVTHTQNRPLNFLMFKSLHVISSV